MENRPEQWDTPAKLKKKKYEETNNEALLNNMSSMYLTEHSLEPSMKLFVNGHELVSTGISPADGVHNTPFRSCTINS